MQQTRQGADQLRTEHRTRERNIQAVAEELASTARLIAAKCEECLVQGGQIGIQPQMQFLVGALARLLKDQGVVEAQQQHGATQNKPLVRRR